MNSIKCIETDINEPGLRGFTVSEFNNVAAIRFTINSNGTPGYLVFKGRKDGIVCIPIPADRVVAVVYADGTRSITMAGKQFKR